MYTIEELYDLTHTLAAEYLRGFTYPWEALGGIRAMILELGPKLDPEQYAEVSPQVWVHRTATVAPTAYLGAPCIIGAGTEVRHCAFVRGSALVGENCVVGNSVELKNVILFDNVQTPHYNYVGDSILGYRSHMGAGSITSNVKSDKSLVVVHGQGENVETGLKKFGAMLGDFVEVGCNSVLNPGHGDWTESNVYPLSCVRGVVPARHHFTRPAAWPCPSAEDFPLDRRRGKCYSERASDDAGRAMVMGHFRDRRPGCQAGGCHGPMDTTRRRAARRAIQRRTMSGGPSGRSSRVEPRAKNHRPPPHTACGGGRFPSP